MVARRRSALVRGSALFLLGLAAAAALAACGPGSLSSPTARPQSATQSGIDITPTTDPEAPASPSLSSKEAEEAAPGGGVVEAANLLMTLPVKGRAPMTGYS